MSAKWSRRKVVSPNDFTDLDQVQDRLAAFEHPQPHPPA